MFMKRDKAQKVRAQVKSRWYYLFWGAATISVFVGQIYVGSGYREMSRSINTLIKMQYPRDTGYR